MGRYRPLPLLLIVALGMIGSACRAPQPEVPPQPEYRPLSTIKDLMDSVVDPSADFLFESVVTVVSAAGVEEKAPTTPEEWANVRRRAVTLVESANLLVVPGRRVARPGEKSEYPKIELEPEEIQTLIDKDWATWTKLALALQDAGMLAVKAIDAKSVEGLLDSGDKIEASCENCHLKYWYPNQAIPDIPASVKPQNLPPSADLPAPAKP